MSPASFLLTVLIVAQEGGTEPVAPNAAVSICVACQADPAPLRAQLGAEQWAVIERGEVVTSRTDLPAHGEHATETEVQSAAILNHPPARVWEVLSDFEARPRYVSDLKDLTVVRREGNRAWLAEHLRIMLVNIRYQVITTSETEKGTISWELDKSVPHDIAETRGVWAIAPLDDGKRTLLHYRSRIDTGQPVPKFIEGFMTERSLPGLVTSLRGEVERRFGETPR